MKNFYYILTIILVGACSHQKQSDQFKEADAMRNIKSCKVYSSEFVLFDPNDKGILIQEFNFNKKGFVNELIRYDMNGEVIGEFDIYGENNPFPMPSNPEYVDTLLTVINYDSLGVIINKEVKQYNIYGWLAMVEFYDGDSTLVKKNTYKYNNFGIIKEDVYWDVELNKPKQKIRYEFEYFTDKP